MRVSDGMTNETHTLGLLAANNIVSYGSYFRLSGGSAYNSRRKSIVRASRHDRRGEIRAFRRRSRSSSGPRRHKEGSMVGRASRMRDRGPMQRVSRRVADEDPA